MGKRERIAAAAVLAAVLGVGGRALAGPLHTAYNLWYENPRRIYSTNYSKGILYPAGSEVTAVERSSRKVEFEDAETHVRFAIAFVGRHHGDLTAEAFADRLFTAKDFKQLTAGFTAEEVQAIEAGKVRPGMSKAAVLVARGYPPEVATPSTGLDTWKYWYDRFRSYLVRFADGRVVSADR